LSIGAGGGVAWFAHIGGFLIGILLIKTMTKRRKPKVWVH
jgi:membrane associated rhomboid family serine protease